MFILVGNPLGLHPRIDLGLLEPDELIDAIMGDRTVSDKGINGLLLDVQVDRYLFDRHPHKILGSLSCTFDCFFCWSWKKRK
jgi:hypothetical protein